MRKKRAGIVVDIIGESDLFRFDLEKLISTLRKMLRKSGVRSADVTISIATDKEITLVNKKFLGHRGATDVISFDLSEATGRRVFDITVNAQRAAKEAHARGHSGESELALYAVHGLLHCLGYDDLRKADAARMHKKEDEILMASGYGRTYSGD
jgi:probable rRNA maturation factor